MIDRVLLKYALYDTLPVLQPTYTPYLDVSNTDPELIIALERLQKHGIMK
ncbi:MAG: hypothetical protein H6765_03545 [Candidatus Peribacteria bacterium]|nr:MAG: hypothetical protein H6765_03545 [Candidatus Peribacteria bacterium]